MLILFSLLSCLKFQDKSFYQGLGADHKIYNSASGTGEDAPPVLPPKRTPTYEPVPEPVEEGGPPVLPPKRTGNFASVRGSKQ
jgi:hypothetical protein